MTKLQNLPEKHKVIPPKVRELLKDTKRLYLLDQLLQDSCQIVKDLESVPAFHDFTGMCGSDINGFCYRVTSLANVFRNGNG